MRTRLTQFIQQLRTEGIRISVAETLDAMAAVEKAGLEPRVLREALSATLVKDELDRAGFDAAFDAFFSAPPRAAAGDSRKGRPGAGGAPGGSSSSGRPAGSGGGGGSAPPEAREAEQAERPPRPAAASPREHPPHAEPDARRAASSRGTPDAPPKRPGEPSRKSPSPEKADDARTRAARAADPSSHAARASGASGDASRRPAGGKSSDPRALLRRTIAELSADDVDAAREVAHELGRRFAARAARRERRQRSGRIDVRRTIRASISRGGAMIGLERRGRRPGRPHLVTLCDVSGSVARASELLLSIAVAAESAFGRTRHFAFVDRLVPVAFENGHVLPEGELDLWGRSDFGAVLRDAVERERLQLDRSTVLLVLGDARNNRLPPRADLWKRLTARARAVVWAVPEPRARWDTGDSALSAYAPACRLVMEATTLHGLAQAVRAVAR